jgi:hypothetical protein
MLGTQSKSMNIHNKCKKFSSFNMLEKSVTHADIDMCAFDKTGQISNRYLNMQYLHIFNKNHCMCIAVSRNRQKK